MVVFPNCKINLGLSVLRKRDDGFHDLETVFYPLQLREALELVTSTELQFESTGIDLELGPGNNLCLKAYRLLKNDFPDLPPVKMHLHKMIPAGAGLGGGSADAAFTLTLLNQKYRLGLDTVSLQRYALELGSDCPFFILNSPCIAKGRGEILEPLQLDLSPYRIVLINPGIHINTGKAFSLVQPGIPAETVASVVKLPVSSWKGRLLNDFEKPVVDLYPEIGKIIADLYRAGAVYASMTGTGSTVFGLLPAGNPFTYKEPGHYFVRVL